MSDEIPVLPVGQRTDGTPVLEKLTPAVIQAVSEARRLSDDYVEERKPKQAPRFSAEDRTEAILEVLKKSPFLLSTIEITKSYIDNPTESDKVTTGNILQILAAAKVVRRETKTIGQRQFHMYGI